MTEKRRVALAASLAGAAWMAAGAALAQPLDPTEIEQAIAAPTAAASFAACAEGYPAQGMVKLVIAASAAGAVGITATVPTIDTGLLACLRAAAGTIQVRASGTDSMMIVSMDFGGEAAPAAPVPPSGAVVTAPAPAPAAPPPGAAYVYAVPGQPPAAKPAPSYSPALLSMRSKGLGLTIPGVVLAAVGGLHMLAPLLAWVIGSAGCDPDWDGGSCWGYEPVLFGISMAGFAGFMGGVAMISKGSMMRGQAGAVMKGRVTEGPSADLYGRGAGMSSLGGALVAGGGVAVFIPLIYGIGQAMICGDSSGDCAPFSPGLLGVALAGLAGMGTGVALLVVGSKKKNAAMYASIGTAAPRISFAPIVTKDALGVGVLGIF